MKKIVNLTLVFLIVFSHVGWGAKWTVQTAREKAFRDIRQKIDITRYPSQDPDFEENQDAIKKGKRESNNRFITHTISSEEPPAGYIVSKLNQYGQRQHDTEDMFYADDGHLITVRIFSSNDYPKTTYTYCMEREACVGGGETYQSGKLMSVAFHVSKKEVFYFGPDGKDKGHFKN